MMTPEQREFIQLYQEADKDTKMFLADLLLCFVGCGDDFIEEITAVKGDAVAMRAVVDKWLPTATAARKSV